jgi:hypothetical protein
MASNKQQPKREKFMSTSLLRVGTSALKQPFHALTVAAVLLAAGSAPAASTVISDSTFALSNWAQQIGPATTAGVTAGYNQVMSGGDPGSYLAVNYVPPPGSTSWELSMMAYYTGQSYSPKSMGPISSISFSADLINLTGQNIVFFGLFQDNTAYLLELPGLQLTSSWTGFSGSGSTLNNFLSQGLGGTHPNLLNGDPIEFGIMTSVSVGGVIPPGAYGIDNFNVTITPTPEPRTWALGAFGILALALSKRMKSGARSSKDGFRHIVSGR